jgi:tetratricopeptide (TPR) repeat protein
MPGVTVNLSKSGASMSFGVRGAHYTVGSRGRRVTVGVPGTGLYYTQIERRGREHRTRPGASTSQASIVPAVEPNGRLRLGTFRRLITPPNEQHLVDGLRALVEGDDAKALDLLRGATHTADGAMLAGVLALKQGSLQEAEADLKTAIEHADHLGKGLERYGISSTLSVQISDEFTAHLPHTREGAMLALVEVYQAGARNEDALRCLAEIRQVWPEDPVVLGSLCELLLEGRSSPDGLRQVVSLTDGVQNLTPVHTVLLLYRARALRLQKLPDSAVESATVGLSRRTNRSVELLRDLRYERALALADAGQSRRARAELERIYSEDSSFADVAIRLGMAPPVGEPAS